MTRPGRVERGEFVMRGEGQQGHARLALAGHGPALPGSDESERIRRWCSARAASVREVLRAREAGASGTHERPVEPTAGPCAGRVAVRHWNGAPVRTAPLLGHGELDPTADGRLPLGARHSRPRSHARRRRARARSHRLRSANCAPRNDVSTGANSGASARRRCMLPAMDLGSLEIILLLLLVVVAVVYISAMMTTRQ